jgi:hypothetical protein
MRGRGRKGPNPLTRTYESNGPDVKIRGTAMHIAEKYQQLARDAQASGDRVMSENYNQHAEHYQRIVAAAQPQQQPMAHMSARGDSDDGYEAGAMNGSGHAHGNERPSQDQSSADNDLMDADSPQPFIDDMPVIDQEGKVNGSAQKAGSDDEDGDDKPRRRSRTVRSRAPRRGADSAEGDGAQESADAAPSGGDEEQAKPRRRVARPRRAKAAEDAPAEAPAGE